MAKARPIDNLECDAPAVAVASEVLRVRFDEIVEFQLAALKPDGVDGVHDMRVVSHRGGFGRRSGTSHRFWTTKP